MIRVRRAQERGHFNHGWLETYHTFSFGEYYDPEHHGFHSLRVINEDVVQPGQGFGTHPHADMEILTYILSGRLAHKDSLGTGSQIEPGEIQRMSAGTGIRHSEFNASDTEPVHLLQIWILPSQKKTAPSYEQKTIAFPANDWALLASPTGKANSVKVGQDALVWALKLEAGKVARLPLPKDRYGWIQMARGQAELAGFDLSAGDGASMDGSGHWDLHAKSACEVLFFDLH